MLLCTIKEPSGVKKVGTEKEKDIMLRQKLINAVNAVGADVSDRSLRAAFA